jgi:hypothetical protein
VAVAFKFISERIVFSDTSILVQVNICIIFNLEFVQRIITRARPPRTGVSNTRPASSFYAALALILF